MKKKVMKWFLPSLLVCLTGMMTGCSVKEEDAYIDLRHPMNDAMIISSIFDGEWTVNKLVVDTARLVVRANGVMEVRLPERYLLGLCFSQVAGEDTTTIEPGNTPTLMDVYQQGYSETSIYMSFSPERLESGDAQRHYVNSHFIAAIDGKPYSIGLLSDEIATAVMQRTTGQWTIGIPINAFSVTNLALSTYEPEAVKQLPQPVTIYYNTTRRIK